jgi:hypothetical protein
MLKTRSGMAMGHQRHEFMQLFVRQFLGEVEMGGA